MAREVDILRRIMENLPPDQGGPTKLASSQIDDLVNDALAGLGKAAQEDEEKKEKETSEATNGSTSESKTPEQKAEEKTAMEGEVPPEFKAQQEKVEDKAEEKAEEKKEKMDEETKEALASIGAAFLQQYPHLLADNDRHVKVAASAMVAKDEFMQKVAAEALADEMAKIAYAEMAGVSFDEYLEKVAFGRAAREAVSGAAESLGRGGRRLRDAMKSPADSPLANVGSFGSRKEQLRGVLGVGDDESIIRSLLKRPSTYSKGAPGLEPADIIGARRAAQLIGGGTLAAGGLGTAAALSGGD